MLNPLKCMQLKTGYKIHKATTKILTTTEKIFRLQNFVDELLNFH